MVPLGSASTRRRTSDVPRPDRTSRFWAYRLHCPTRLTTWVGSRVRRSCQVAFTRQPSLERRHGTDTFARRGSRRRGDLAPVRDFSAAWSSRAMPALTGTARAPGLPAHPRRLQRGHRPAAGPRYLPSSRSRTAPEEHRRCPREAEAPGQARHNRRGWIIGVRELRAHLAGVLAARAERPEPLHVRVWTCRGVRRRSGPGHQRGGQRRQGGGRTGRASPWRRGREGDPSRTAQRSRNPSDTTADNGVVGGNRQLSGQRGCQGRAVTTSVRCLARRPGASVWARCPWPGRRRTLAWGNAWARTLNAVP
ncbi:hypothetical protein SANTM175S_03534 [Streptomyces antimycoticus]